MKLDSEVMENGENFSVGERQLLCIARALLRRCKVSTAEREIAGDTKIIRLNKPFFFWCWICSVCQRNHTNDYCNPERCKVETTRKVSVASSCNVLPLERNCLQVLAIMCQTGLIIYSGSCYWEASGFSFLSPFFEYEPSDFLPHSGIWDHAMPAKWKILQEWKTNNNYSERGLLDWDWPGFWF